MSAFDPKQTLACGGQLASLVDNMRMGVDRDIYRTGSSLPRRPLDISAFRTGLLLVSALFSTAVAAEGLESTDPRLVGERPNASGAPTLITVSVYLFDIDEIDDVNQRFSVDLFAYVTWQDSRLALPEAQQSGQVRTLPLNEIRTPRVLVLNDRGLSLQLPRVAEVDDLGNVELQQRVSGELAADLQFKEFPFDIQRLPIDIISYQYTPDEIRFSLNADIGGDDGSFSADGWRLRILDPEFGEFAVPTAGIVRPRLTHFIEAQRDTQYYLLTMFLPMSLIVFMSWMVFWLQPNIVPPRIAISTASIFSLIAFGFSVRLSLPRVSYMTRADIFVVGCTLLVVLALAVAVIGSRWANADRMEHALCLNAAARWIYVGLFCLVATTALMI